MPVELDVPTFAEVERLLGATTFVVPRSVREELGRLADGGGKEAAAARVGGELAAERCKTIDDAADSTDKSIARLAETGAIDYVVTNDTPLRNRVLDEGIPVISLRGRTKLAVIRP